MKVLNIEKRENKCNHFAKKERKKGKIPGILYGRDVNNFMFEVGAIELNSQIKENGEHGLIGIDVDGSTLNALIKEVQRDPINHKILHIDLEKVEGDEEIVTEVPVILKGEGLVKSIGGIIQKTKNSLKVQCKANSIPKGIDVDISDLKIGDAIRIGDVEFGEDFTFTEPENTVIVSITENSFTFEDGDNMEQGEDNLVIE